MTRDAPNTSEYAPASTADVAADTDGFLAHAVNSVPIPVFVKDERHRIVFFNDAFCAALGRTRAELQGKNDFDLVPAEEARVYWEKDDAVFRSGEPQENEEALTDANGVRHWLLTRKSIVRMPDGGRYLVGVISDITELKRRETELLRAKEEAETANRTKTEFLATMTHELRTPLNAIIGFSEVLHLGLAGEMDPRQRDYVENIHRSGSHLLDLINDVLDVSRIDAQELVLRETAVRVDRIAAGCCQQLKGRAARGGISLTFTCADPPPYVLADPVRLKQILVNLLSNAIKFTPSGGDVTLAVSHAADGVTLVVTDTGVGMQAEDIPIALEPFRQLDASLARRQEGAGLGLPLAKRLVELHGGELRIDSTPGSGTRVVIRLPASRIVDTPT